MEIDVCVCVCPIPFHARIDARDLWKTKKHRHTFLDALPQASMIVLTLVPSKKKRRKNINPPSTHPKKKEPQNQMLNKIHIILFELYLQEGWWNMNWTFLKVSHARFDRTLKMNMGGGWGDKIMGSVAILLTNEIELNIIGQKSFQGSPLSIKNLCPGRDSPSPPTPHPRVLLHSHELVFD